MKKTIKCIISLVLSFTMVFSLFSATGITSFAENDIVKYLEYEIKDGKVSITDCSSDLSGDIVIPDTIEGYPVTSIGDNAFYNCDSLESIVIPDSVTAIGDNAFSNCRFLESIVIPDSVTSIGDNAFHNCGSLAEVTIGSGVTSIGDDAFYNCNSLESIVIPDSVTSIGNNTFYFCDRLVEVTIGSGVTSIGDKAFSDCDSLESIVIPDSVTAIGDNAFYNCISLAEVTIGSGVTSIGDKAFSDCDSLESIVIPDSVTAIGDNAFYNCISLAEVTIGSGVTSIGDNAFYNCGSLESIVIPDSVTAIGDNAFYCCNSLESIVIPDSVISIGDNAFFETVYVDDESNWDNNVLYINNHLIQARHPIISNYKIKQGIKTIADYAFHNCRSLESIVIPDSVTSIGDNAFSYCRFLESIVIPDSVTSIGDNAFYHCDSLAEVTIGSGVTSIGEKVFYDCDSLESIVIPDSVTSIGDYAFYDCNSLAEVTIGSGVTSIGARAFYWCNSLESIVIPDSVTSIGEFAFLDTVYYDDESNWDNNVLYINNHLIKARYPIISNYKIKQGTKTIADYAFFQCNSLESIVIPDSVTSIGEKAFWKCEKLAEVTIGSGVTSIGDDAFYWCKRLKEVIICNQECNIYDSEGTIYSGAVIHGYTGSTAEAYATKYNREFIAIAGDEPTTKEPETTTARPPETTTWEPETTTTRPPETTTWEPETTTTRPPETTTWEPETTTARPPETTTWEPETTTTRPPETTEPTTWDPTTRPPETTTWKPETTIPSTTAPSTTVPSTVRPPETTTGTGGGGLNPHIGVGIFIFNFGIVVTPGMSVDDFISNVYNEYVIIISPSGITLGGNAIIGTGCVIIICDAQGNTLYQYESCVKYDINGDGKVTAADARLALRAAARIDVINGIYAYAADADGDARIAAGDARIILRAAAGLDKEEPTASPDFDRMKNLLKNTYCAEFDYKTADTAYVVDNIIHTDRGVRAYKDYFDYDASYSEIIGWEKSDPLNVFTGDYYFKLPAENIKWICENIYQVKFDENHVSNGNSYCYDGNVYMVYIDKPYKAESHTIQIQHYTLLDDGKYEITAEYCVASAVDGSVILEQPIKIIAEWKQIDGKYDWVFYSVEHIVTPDFDRMETLVTNMFGNTFDYKTADTAYVVDYLIHADLFIPTYEAYFGEDSYEAFGEGNKNSDPLNKFSSDTGTHISYPYYKIPAENIKWICENIYQVEFDENYISNTGESYCYGDYVYIIYPQAGYGPFEFKTEINEYRLLDNGRYEISAYYYESEDFGSSFELECRLKVIAEWKQIDGKYDWVFYNIDRL